MSQRVETCRNCIESCGTHVDILGRPEALLKIGYMQKLHDMAWPRPGFANGIGGAVHAQSRGTMQKLHPGDVANLLPDSQPRHLATEALGAADWQEYQKRK